MPTFNGIIERHPRHEKMSVIKLCILLLMLFCVSLLHSQVNSMCANATPFCTGQTMNFPAATNASPAQSGPYYGCLGSQPNPAWFFMQIANSGSMSISMAANNDIDFICWGPFPSLAGACNSLTSSNMQSCSYSASNTETCTIANAIAGQFYLMLITNFSNQVQNITFSQNNANQTGAATTNCGFVCIITPTTSGMVCSGGAITMSLAPNTSTSVNTYTWFGPSAFTSTSAILTLTNVTQNTTYTINGSNTAVINNVPYSGTCTAMITTSVIPYPTFSVTPTTTDICQGGGFFAGVTFTPASNPTNYNYSWAPSSGGGIWQLGSPSTLITPTLLPTTTTISTLIYSVTVWPTNTAVTCAVTKTMAVTINNPLTPSLTPQAPLCDIFAPVQLTATPGGGTWTATPALAITANGLFTPSLATIGGTTPISYAASVGTCVVTNTMAVSVSKYYTPALTSTLSTICEYDPVYNLMNIAQSTISGSWSGPQINNNIFNPAGLISGSYSFTYNTISLPNPTVCPASTVLVVSLFNPPVPIIDPILPKCNNSTTVSLTATPSGGVWSGNSGISALGIQTPSNSSIGTNTVVYTAGLGTCVASNSKTFQVSQYNTPALTGTVPHLCFNSNVFNLMSIVQNTNGVWQGTGTQFGTKFNPANLPTGIYGLKYYTYSIPNATICPDSSSILVSLLNPPTPTITTIAPICNVAGPLQMTVSPNTGNWTGSSYLSTNGVFTPSLASIGMNQIQYAIGTNTCNVQQSSSVSVEAFVSAAITASISDQCNTNSPLILAPFTLNSQGNWSGTGIIGSAFNPALSGAGTFTLTYNTSSSPSALCPDQSTVSVRVFSLATPSIGKEGPFCNNATPVQLMVSPVGGIFKSTVNGAVSPSGIFNPALARIGDNFITYSIAVGPCIANVTSTISVEKFISADFAKDPANAYCKNQLPFNLNSLVQNPGGYWSGQGVNSLGMFDPAKAEIGYNLVKYETHSEPSFLLCPDHQELRIKVKETPSFTLQNSTTSGCVPFTLNMNLISDEPGIIKWIFGDGQELNNTNSISHSYTNPGSYSVVVSYQDSEAEGCHVQVKYDPPIIVNATPKADFSIQPDEISIANPEVDLLNLSTVLAENKYVWSVLGFEDKYDVNPKMYFPQIGFYSITLKAITQAGCIDQITKMIEVKNDFNCFIPNSFSPNYDDINDVFIPVFSPYGLDFNSFKMDIYDRWGHVLYHTSDVSKGWNGTYKNDGEIVYKEDIYIYKVSYKDVDGKSYSRVGNVTLIK